MKKLGTLALTLTLTGAMALPALAAEEPELVIAPADTGYGQTIVLNGETLDLTGIPGVSGEELLPLRLLAEADHGENTFVIAQNGHQIALRCGYPLLGKQV